MSALYAKKCLPDMEHYAFFQTRLQVQNNECFWLLSFCFADCGGEMAGQEYKRHLLNTLCSSRYVRKEAEILSTVKLVANR